MGHMFNSFCKVERYTKQIENGVGLEEDAGQKEFSRVPVYEKQLKRNILFVPGVTNAFWLLMALFKNQ